MESVANPTKWEKVSMYVIYVCDYPSSFNLHNKLD